MADFVGYRSLQKLRFFLADAFPFLARLGPRPERVAAALRRFPRLASAVERVRRSTLAATLQRISSTFVTGHYAHDRLDWSKISRDAGAVLRLTIVVAALLCILVPLAMTWVWPALDTENISGVPGGLVAGWSLILWLLASSLGWSVLLSGTGAANRAAFLPALFVFLYFGAALVGVLGKSWWSLLLPAQAVLAFVHAETRRRPPTRWELPASVFTALVAGTAIAALTIVVIPTAPWFRGRLLLVALLTGAPLGIALWATARTVTSRPGGGSPLRLDAVVTTIAAAHLLLLVTLAFRGGLSAPAGSIHAMAMQVTGFLWPLYFFIGAGVVFKILRQTGTVQRAAEVAWTGRWFVMFSLTLLLVATVLAWIKPILLLPGFPWPGWLTATAEWLYTASAWIWRSTLWRLALDQLKWLFLGALLLAFWALLQRRLTSAAMARLLFIVILGSFVVVEYYFQAFGFLRAPGTSAVGLFIFAALILWLTHRTSVSYLGGESPWWPARSRVALYGAVLMFVLLPIHARAALRDQTLTNEIFLYLFFGSLNFGLPYYLYLYATRRLKPLAPRATTALGWLLLGAAAAIVLIAGDKVAIAGWSVSTAWATAIAQVDALADGRQITLSTLFPASWIVLRGLIIVALLAAVGAVAYQRQRVEHSGRPASVLAVIGVAAGLACFSNRGLELPLMPQAVTFFITPLHSAMVVDAALAMRYAAVLLPALILARSFAREYSRVRRLINWALAAAVSVAIGLIWPAREPWLRSTGVLFALGAIGLIVVATLAIQLRDALQHAITTTGNADEQPVQLPLLSWRELRIATAGLVVALSVVAATRAFVGRGRPFALSGSSNQLLLPARWSRTTADAASGTTRFEHPSWSAAPSTLTSQLHVSASDSSDLSLLRTATTGIDAEPIKFERWEGVVRSAFAVDFRVHSRSDSVPGFGTAAVVRLPNGEALLLTAMYSSTDFARRWDVARALQAWARQ